MWEADIEHIESHQQKFNSFREAGNLADPDSVPVNFNIVDPLRFE